MGKWTRTRFPISTAGRSSFFATMGNGDYIQEMMDDALLKMFNSAETIEAYGITQYE